MTRLLRTAPAVVLAFVLSLGAGTAAPENVVVVKPDPTMAAAIDTARSHLPRVFDAVMNEDGTAHPALSLKVAFPAGNREEVIWVANIRRHGNRFTAILANQPMYLADLAAGDEVSFKQDMIADWGLPGKTGRLFGHYTTRVLLETMPAEQAAKVRELLTEDPLPAPWH